MRKRTGSGLLIVVELGSEWPSFIDAGSSARRVISQVDGETPTAFAERVASSLDGCFGKGIQLSRAVLACNERTDEAAQAARRKLAGLALGAMAKHKAGKVVLTASPLSGGRLRHALAGLAQGLFDEWRTAGLEASLELGEEARSAPTAASYAFTACVA